MLMDSAKISEIIRMKKKKMMMADPELVDTDSKPDMNPTDAFNAQQMGRIEVALNPPKKINADETNINDPNGLNAGLSPDEKKRMGRLRAYFDTMDLSHESKGY